MKFGLYQQAFFAFSVFTVTFSLALGLRLNQIVEIFRNGKTLVFGVLAQLVFFPVLTIGFVYLLKPPAEIAMAVLFISSCPGGSLSNYLSFMARGDWRYSITLTLMTSLISVITTPVMLVLMANSYVPTREIMTSIEVSKLRLIITLAVILLSPLAMGIWIAHKYEKFAQKALRPFRSLGFVLLVSIIVFSIIFNRNLFNSDAVTVIKYVFAHNLMGLGVGYFSAKWTKMGEQKARALSIEVGYQNTTPALAVSLAYFQALPLVSFSVGLWAVWQFASGFLLVAFWRYRRQ